VVGGARTVDTGAGGTPGSATSAISEVLVGEGTLVVEEDGTAGVEVTFVSPDSRGVRTTIGSVATTRHAAAAETPATKRR
jgi:hypothetical protein